MVCHGELVKLKPHERYLTSFYLMVAIGGALGGVFVVAIAPWLFAGFWKFNLAIWTSLLLLFIVLIRDPKSWIHEHWPVVAMALLSSALVLPGVIGAGDLVGVVSRATTHLPPGCVAVGLMSAVAFKMNSRLATMARIYLAGVHTPWSALSTGVARERRHAREVRCP
jgi:hypothetical protein